MFWGTAVRLFWGDAQLGRVLLLNSYGRIAGVQRNSNPWALLSTPCGHGKEEALARGRLACRDVTVKCVWMMVWRRPGGSGNSTTIATAAVANMLGGDPLVKRSRNPDIMADAAHAILTRRSRRVTGQFFIDDEVLLAEVRCMCYYEA